MDRTLFILPHFERYIGSKIKIKLRVAISNQKHFEARIEKVEGEKIFLALENETISVTLGEIQKASLVIYDKEPRALASRDLQTK